jgi:hypothetical protein
MGGMQTPNDGLQTLGDQDSLVALSRQIASLQHQLDHRDAMLHEIDRKVAALHDAFTRWSPLLETVTARLDTGGGWRRWRQNGGGAHAIHKDGP